MEKIRLDDITSVIEYKNAPATESLGSEGVQSTEEAIRVYVPRRSKGKASSLLRLLLSTAAFLLLFLGLFWGFENIPRATGDSREHLSEKEESATEESLLDQPVLVSPMTYKPLIIDETKTGVEVNINEDYSLYPLIASTEGVKVLIVHSHNSESVSEDTSVSEAGEVITQLLISAGIPTYHCIEEHDRSGSIGAYSRMRESISFLISKHPDVICIIDIHDSESGLPVTFTFGTENSGWRENLRVGEAVSAYMTNIQTAFRFLPGALGQDSGILTLNVGFGGEHTSESDARTAIAQFAEAFIKICNKNASAP